MKSTLGSRRAIERTTSTTSGIPPITVVTAQATFAASCAPAIHIAPPIVIPTIEQTSHTRSR